jgi:hypothetical protein
MKRNHDGVSSSLPPFHVPLATAARRLSLISCSEVLIAEAGRSGRGKRYLFLNRNRKERQQGRTTSQGGREGERSGSSTIVARGERSFGEGVCVTC